MTSFEFDIEVATRYLALKRSAEDRKLDFNLTLTSFKKLCMTKTCYFTKKKLVYKSNFSIDRVDNSKGYIIGNVVACDKTFNAMKSNLSIAQILLLYKGIQKHIDNAKY